jgi:hypothetical protein
MISITVVPRIQRKRTKALTSLDSFGSSPLGDCHAIGESVWLRAKYEMCGDDAGKKILSFGRSSELTFDRLGVECW